MQGDAVAGLASVFAEASFGTNDDVGATPLTTNGPHTNQVDDGACAICLDVVDEVDVALVKHCLHAFCTPCIVRWTTFQLDSAYQRRAAGGRNVPVQTSATCPCCKTQFDHLLIYRTLDGDLTPDLREESVCLLRRARWLCRTEKEMAWENDHAVAVAAQQELDREFGGPHQARGYARAFQDDDFLDEEERYMTGLHQAGRSFSRRGGKGGGGCSGAPDSAGIVIGNRRFGPNGQIAQGHRTFARPVGPRDRTEKGKGKHLADQSFDSPAFGNGKAPLIPEIDSVQGSSSGAALSLPSGAAAPGIQRGSGESPSSPSCDSPIGSAARGKKALKRLEAKAKKESKECLRRAKRVETMALSIAKAKGKRESGGGGLESQLPDLPDVEDAFGGGAEEREEVGADTEETPVEGTRHDDGVFVID